MAGLIHTKGETIRVVREDRQTRRAWLRRKWKEKIRSKIRVKGERRMTAGTERGREHVWGGGSHAHRPPLHKAGWLGGGGEADGLY